MDPYRRRLREALARITEVEPDAVQLAKMVVIDLREPAELALGLLPGAHTIGLAELGDRIRTVADPDTPLLLYCAVGERSAIAAAALEDQGYANVTSLAGGLKRWMEEGRQIVAADSLSAEQRHRYARHIVLPAVGVTGQQRLLDARVAIVGAGGLGSPAALYLAAAGVGAIGLIDDDVVDLSNLQRQILHTTGAAGRPKPESGAKTLRDLNPEVIVDSHHARLAAENAETLLSGYDVIVDGTDNLATRYLLNDAALRLRIPVIHGSVFRFEGQVSVFLPYAGPCYRCLFPEPPPAELAPNCAQAGVFGVLPGVVGTMQATETIKLILGLGNLLVGRLLTYDALEQDTHVVRFERDPNCPSCGDEAAPPELRDEAEYC
ncbi:MAG: molybdopterin-synthase adenylyltransferase MoeB [Acidimicrobiia bacterium]|nr:molybdopterin-synthase adenylyltransferase MoeB [Acidimicrobiia bacterium]